MRKSRANIVCFILVLILVIGTQPSSIVESGDVQQIDQETSASRAQTDSWLNGWKYRKSHTIIGSAGAGFDYQIPFTVHYGNGNDSGRDVYCESYCSEDFSDIRFSSNTGTALDYWIFEKTDLDNAIVWVEVDTLAATTDTTIFMYYQNPSAYSESNGEEVFTFFDNFNDASLDTTKWYPIDTYGDIRVENNELIIDGLTRNSWNRGLVTNDTFERANYSVEFDYE